MNVLIAGGTGLIGRALTRSLHADGHKTWILTRSPEKAVLPLGVTAVGWDGRTPQGWGELVNEMDAVVNLAGVNLSSWPWTQERKNAFWNSRVWAGQAITEAVRLAKRRPKVLIQSSGVNHYGLRGDTAATEASPTSADFLSRLTVAWEFSTMLVEEMGVRRAVVRQAVVLSHENIILKLMEWPTRLFVGGKLGEGSQFFPWIHIADEVGAIRFLMENEQARGGFNLVAPHSTTNAEFMRTLARTLKRPYWFHVTAFLLKTMLGEMSMMVLEGRQVLPKHLDEVGYKFKFPTLPEALTDLFRA